MTAAAEAAGVSVRCARKWVARYRLEGESGLQIAPLPRRVATAPRPTAYRSSSPSPLALHRAEIADTLGMALSTVSASWRARAWAGSGASAWSSRSLRALTPGELVHVDVSGSAGSRAAPASAPSGASVARGTTAATDLEGVRR